MKPFNRWISALLSLLVLACVHAEKIDNTSFSGTEEEYKLEVALKVAMNWAFANDDNASNNKDEARILLTIDRKGQIMDIAVVKEPRSKRLKASILKAIKQSERFSGLSRKFQ